MSVLCNCCVTAVRCQVKQPEREAAQALFATQEGADVLSTVSEESRHLEAQKEAAEGGGHKNQLSAEQKAEISRAIEAASTKEEMDLIERQLRVSGDQICGCTLTLSSFSLPPSVYRSLSSSITNTLAASLYL